MSIHRNIVIAACGVMETIEHELAKCPVVCHFWNQVQVFIDKITGRSLSLTTKIKLLGWIPEDSIQLSKNVIILVKWTLTIARFSIDKAAANFRIHKEVTPILPIFRAITKSIICFQFKIHELKGKQYCLLYTSPSPRDLSTSRMPSSA